METTSVGTTLGGLVLCETVRVEARAGIEPTYTALQAAA